MRMIAAIVLALASLVSGVLAQTLGSYPTIPYTQLQNTDFFLLYGTRFTLNTYVSLPIMAQWFQANMGLANFSCSGVTWPKSASAGVTTCTNIGVGAPSSLSELSVTDYGAIGDGAVGNAAVNYAAITTILAAGRCAFFPQNATRTANYNIGANTVSLLTSQCMRADDGVILTYTGASAIFVKSYENTSGWASATNFVFEGVGSSGNAITLATSQGIVAGFRAENILCLDTVSCIADESSTSNYVSDVYFHNVRAERARGPQIYVRRSRGNVWCDVCRVDLNVAGQTVPFLYNGIEFDDFAGLILRDVDVVGPTSDTTYRSASTGIVLTGNPSSAVLPPGNVSVWLERVLVESGAGNGIYINSANMVYANGLTSYSMLGNGIVLTDVTNSSFANVLAYVGHSRTGAAAAAVGFQMTGASNAINVANLVSTLNTGGGVAATGTGTSQQLTNVTSYSNDTYNFVTAGSVDYVNINGGYFASAGIANTSLGSSGTHNVINNVGGIPGSFSLQNSQLGTSGASIPLLNTANTWSAAQSFSGGTSPTQITATSNYGLVTYNGSTALSGMVGTFGGANGDASTLYLSAPSAISLYGTATAFKVPADNQMSNATSAARWTTSYAYIQDAKTYHTTQASAPTPSSCGTGSPSVDAGSSANSGKVTFGTGATSCILTFATAFPTNAYCTVLPMTQPAAVANIPYIAPADMTKTSFKISGGTATQSYTYTCSGN